MDMMKPAAAALDEGAESGAPDASHDNAEESTGNTFFLPSDFLGGKEFKAGDTISLTVVGKDADGDTEVSFGDAGGDQMSWRDDLKKTMAASGQESTAT